MSRHFILSIDDKYEIKVNYFIESEVNHIFNTYDFFNIHKTERAFYFQLCKKESEIVLGTIHFTEVASDVFKSPAKGTFGGFVIQGNIDFSIYEQFIRTVDDYLWCIGATKIEVLMQPMCHNPSLFSLTYNILIRLGYSVDNHELNYNLVVDNICFSAKINHGNRKRLNKCLREGLIAKELDYSVYEQAYSVILENRIRRGFMFSMNYEQILQMVNMFPEKIKLFGVFKKETIVCSSICVVINPLILYVYAWGDIDNMQNYSPITLLANYIYEYAQKKAFQLLDLGTSTILGEPNVGLMQFKKNLGCQESLKLSFSKYSKINN
ncbi:MAG: hypothetical protein RM022_030305 [Nostoc sp. EfeVER01]|uniref:hypothetical protein n=1 Tax=unclassified Nostoc TaxID=2593658 RepID=UPI002AD3D572|nr:MULTISPECIES: hypothetical protein [unclassified Nostoc]MDZ7946031.1 hypothetical protein [Nostoc sp. EfeVER01]MDZ7993363.1 hypothetical protein [Nostoc sp. EspVER01]